MAVQSERYYDLVFKHHTDFWKAEPNIFLWDKGPIEKLPFQFRVLEFAPMAYYNRNTAGLSENFNFYRNKQK